MTTVLGQYTEIVGAPHPSLRVVAPSDALGRPDCGDPTSRPGSPEDLERIITVLLPATIPTDLASWRGADARRAWTAITATPLYEAMTIWVMAAWPDQMLDRVDTMARTAIAAAWRVRDGQWSIERLVAIVGKAGSRGQHHPVHHHLGHEVRLVSYDALGFEPADETEPRRPVTSSLGPAVVADLRLALGEHAYMVTPAAAALVDRYTDIAVDHLNAIRAKSVTAERPGGLSGLTLFAAARPTRRANKSQRITEVLRDLPHPTSVALSHLLLGTDHHPQASLLWRQMCGLSATETPEDVVADWRADLPALSPTILAFTERRRRRMRDRCRRGDDLHRTFELAATSEADFPPLAPAI